jgi:biotin transport system substrate-specific component
MPTSTRRTSSTTDLALITTFAAFIAVCAILPNLGTTGGGVAFTLQMFGIFLAASILGARRGTLAVLLYLAIATAGVPVFTGGSGGPSAWTSASGGYLVAFPIAAFIVGLVASRAARLNPITFTILVSIAAVIVTVGVTGPIGAIGMSIKLNVDFGVAWGYATPFFVFDIIKGVVAAIVAAAVLRAFPQLVAKRRA